MIVGIYIPALNALYNPEFVIDISVLTHNRNGAGSKKKFAVFQLNQYHGNPIEGKVGNGETTGK